MERRWRSSALRLQIVLPIIWLAIYAGRNYMMSVRMEEDYAYKEAISTAFEGYKREMEKIAAGDSEIRLRSRSVHKYPESDCGAAWENL